MDNAEPLALLRRLVSINSVFPNERSLSEFTAGYLESCGFSVKLQEFASGRFNVVAQKGPRKGAVLLTSHLDTVPPYNYGKRNPLALQERQGRLHGLGVWDMKAGIALNLMCAKRCVPKGRGLRIVFTADEENISEGTWFAQRKGEFRDCSLAICHEIPDDARGGGGKPPILLGRRGRCVYSFNVCGIGAHAAGSGGISALGLAMRLAQALEKIPMPKGRMADCRLFVRKLHSESRSLSLPTDAVLEADVHYVPPYTNQSFLAYIKKELKRQKFSLPKGCSYDVRIPERKTPYLPAYETDRNDPEAKRFLKAVRKHIGEYSLSYGLTVADENVLSVEGMPVITLGPEGGEAHSCKEWASKKDFLHLAKTVPEAVQELLE